MDKLKTHTQTRTGLVVKGIQQQMGQARISAFGQIVLSLPMVKLPYLGFPISCFNMFKGFGPLELKSTPLESFSQHSFRVSSMPWFILPLALATYKKVLAAASPFSSGILSLKTRAKAQGKREVCKEKHG